MLKKTVERIIDNDAAGRKTIIGRYTYSVRFNWETETLWIYRCLTDAVGYRWISHDGEFVDSWLPVVELRH